MERHSDDAQKQHRRSGALPPFVAPRTRQGTSSTRDGEPPHRRASQLFTPSGVSTPAAPPTPPTEPSAVPQESVPSGAQDEELLVEQLEQAPISLTITGEQPAVDGATIQVIAYDDANEQLQAEAPAGERPQVDGIVLETTEISFEAPSSTTELQIESFWATEPFGSLPSEQPAEPEPAHDAYPSDVAQASGALEGQSPDSWSTPHSDDPLSWHSDREPEAVHPGETGAPDAGVDSDLPLRERPVEANEGEAIAAALERTAARIRSGDLVLPPDASFSTDETALAVALTALLRAPRG
jgi:hypothetical protein